MSGSPTSLELASETARARSREAEFATDTAGEHSTAATHRHAAVLHREAASWHLKADQASRAIEHSESAKVHEQLADRLAAEDGPE
jgi:hypothetical protein